MKEVDVLKSDMKEIKRNLTKVLDAVTRLTAKVDSLDEGLKKQNGRVTKLEEKYEHSLVQDTVLNTTFKEHTKQDDLRFARIEVQLQKVDKIGQENKVYIKVAILVAGLFAPIIFTIIDYLVTRF